MQSIQQLEATLAILDKEYKENVEKAADYKDKVSILFAKWKILQDELLELKKQHAKEDDIFTLEQTGNLRASIEHILKTICTGMRIYYSEPIFLGLRFVTSLSEDVTAFGKHAIPPLNVPLVA